MATILTYSKPEPPKKLRHVQPFFWPKCNHLIVSGKQADTAHGHGQFAFQTVSFYNIDSDFNNIRKL